MKVEIGVQGSLREIIIIIKREKKTKIFEKRRYLKTRGGWEW